MEVLEHAFADEVQKCFWLGVVSSVYGLTEVHRHLEGGAGKQVYEVLDQRLAPAQAGVGSPSSDLFGPVGFPDDSGLLRIDQCDWDDLQIEAGHDVEMLFDAGAVFDLQDAPSRGDSDEAATLQPASQPTSEGPAYNLKYELPDKLKRILSAQFGTPVADLPATYFDYLTMLSERGVHITFNGVMAHLVSLSDSVTGTEAVTDLATRSRRRPDRFGEVSGDCARSGCGGWKGWGRSSGARVTAAATAIVTAAATAAASSSADDRWIR